MSRTIRRKGAAHEHYWVLRDWVRVDGFRREVLISEHSTEGRKILAKYHSDNEFTISMFPSWYRRQMNRLLRAKQRQAMQFFRCQEDPMDGPTRLPVFKRNGQWWW